MAPENLVRPGDGIRDVDEAAIIAWWRTLPEYGELLLKKQQGRLKHVLVTGRHFGPAAEAPDGSGHPRPKSLT